MKRPPSAPIAHRALKLAACLLAGSVVTWVVAWASALWAHADGDQVTSVETADWPGAHSLPSGAAFKESSAFKDLRTWDTHFRWSSFDMRTGWPCRALQGEFSGSTSSSSAPEWDTFAPAPLWLSKLAHDSRLPTRILPIGFATNTLLATGVLLSAVEALALTRLSRRKARGNCPSCAYDRAGIAIGARCPECSTNA